MSRVLTLIDPDTLIGREFIRLVDEAGDSSVEVRAFHTSTDEEHQVAELAGEASVVIPMKQPEDLEGSSIVIVASDDPDADLGTVKDFATLNPQIPLIFAGNVENFGQRALPVGAKTREWPDPAWLRIAHPCLVAAEVLIDGLTHLGIESVAITALEPVSAFGGPAIEVLAQQAIARLQGQAVEQLIEGHTAAFSTVLAEEGQLVEDAAIFWPNAQTTVTRLLCGSFHGHLTQVTITCEHAVDRNELFETLESQPMLALAEAPIGTDSVIDANQIITIPGPSSTDDRHLTFTLMVDGLRIGGALTALQLVDSLT
ncbi:MAG: hypothetical protein GY906_08375 [bacterium]|nr:hypothetical protein [bacterium]